MIDYSAQKRLLYVLYADIPELWVIAPPGVPCNGDDAELINDICAVAKRHKDKMLKQVKHWPAEWCLLWAEKVGQVEDVRARFLESCGGRDDLLKWAEKYGDKPKLRELAAAGGDARTACQWAIRIGDAALMKPSVVQQIIAAGDGTLALEWAERVGDRDEMRALLLSTRDVVSIVGWAKSLGDRDVMRRRCDEMYAAGDEDVRYWIADRWQNAFGERFIPKKGLPKVGINPRRKCWLRRLICGE